MKRTITIVIIVLAVLGGGYYLFRISPQQSSFSGSAGFNLSNIKPQGVPDEINSMDHILGNANAKNTMVVYEDYQCPACAEFAPLVRQLPNVFKDTKVVVRDFPLYQIHKNAVVSAYAAEAAAAQGKYWEMYDVLYSKQPEWENLSDPISKFTEYAQSVGVGDLKKFQDDINNASYKPQVERDLREATALGLQGTPTFIFNGHQLKNDQLQKMLAQAEPYFK